MKKLLLLVLLVPGFSYGDDAAKAFATGFANALNVQLGGREYQPPSYNQQQMNVQVEVTPKVDQHYDAVDPYGNYGRYYFFNHRECAGFLQRSGGAYVDCALVETR